MTRSIPIAISLVLALSGCSTWPSSPPSASTLRSSKLHGAISSASSTAYQRWFSQLAAEKDIYAELDVTSSGEALASLSEGSVDFASTDAPLSSSQINQRLLAFPVTASAVAIAYNLPGCRLTLTLSQVASIFEGTIANYRELGCPSQPITVMYRSGSSGITGTLSGVLSAVNPEWRRRHGSSMQLTLNGATAVKGSSALRDQLMAQKGSFSYLDSALVAAPLQAARIKNGAHSYSADPSQAEQALAYLQVDDNLMGSLQKPSTGYPIVGLNWLLVRRDLDRTKSIALRDSLQWIYGRRGQEDAELLGHVRLPDQIRQRGLQRVSALP